MQGEQPCCCLPSYFPSVPFSAVPPGYLHTYGERLEVLLELKGFSFPAVEENAVGSSVEEKQIDKLLFVNLY